MIGAGKCSILWVSGRLLHSKYKPGNWERAVTPCAAAPAACPPCRAAWRMPGVSAERIRISQNVLFSCFYFIFFVCVCGLFFVFFFPSVIKAKSIYASLPFFSQTFLIYFILPGEKKLFSSLFKQ